MSGSSIKDFIEKLKKCHEERIRQLANTIGTIWSTTGESSNISGNLTRRINNLKNIPSNKDDIDTGTLNKLIGLLKQTVQNDELTQSYKNLRDSIEKYAEKIECPPEQEDEPIDKAIKYLIDFAKTRKDSEMIIDNIILIYTIISKIYYNTLYTKAGKRKNRNVKQQYIALESGSGTLFSNNIDNNKISEVVKTTLKAMSASHFIQGFFNNNELKSYSYTDTGSYPIISYQTSGTMQNTKIEEFIKQIEIVFDYLKDVEKKEYDAYVIKKGTKAKEIFDKILLIGTEYRLGTLFKTGWRKDFGEFHDDVRVKLFPTKKALNRRQRTPRRAPPPKGIKSSRRTRRSVKGNPPPQPPPTDVPMIPPNDVNTPPGQSNNTDFSEFESIIDDLIYLENKYMEYFRSKGQECKSKCEVQSVKNPQRSVYIQNTRPYKKFIKLYGPKSRNAGWVVRFKKFLSTYRNGYRQVFTYRQGGLINHLKFINIRKGGNKTRKKKRKKRNPTRNKKRHKKKKHKTRYKKRKKKKRTRKNK